MDEFSCLNTWVIYITFTIQYRKIISIQNHQKAARTKREPEREEQTEENMPPKFKRHLNDDEVTGSVRSERRNLLEEDSDEEEDFFLRGPTGPKFGPKNDKIRQVQNQVDEVIDVMQENISKVIERGERLDDLQDKSESLSDNASAFSSRAKQLHRRMWWRDTKMKAIIALVIVVLLLIIIIPIILRYH
ncbi:vesicle-associated membrane protein 4 isoform X1 [Brienomyrus brachyistius]|nr:vesicle-associated membrane protein 4 isoform X1 [Brienomyrus brachyistius]